ncbi:MAG: response regulator transcription factor [Acidobacteria bacterium]|nr:response regulator transcription factor [Acidobacteriota bacterium]
MSSTDPVTINVAVIEDQTPIRESLAWLINDSPGFRCTGAFGSMEAALAKLGGDLPDVLLMDIGLPGMSGIEGVREIKQRWPQVLILMLTVYEDNDHIFHALCAGACGYLLKKTTSEQLLKSIRDAIDGGAPISPEIARQVINLFQRFAPPAQANYGLTPHERRLLKLIVDGHSYKSAAAELGVTVNTILFHVKSIYDKLHVHSKSAAVAKALREHLLN